MDKAQLENTLKDMQQQLDHAKKVGQEGEFLSSTELFEITPILNL